MPINAFGSSSHDNNKKMTQVYLYKNHIRELGI